MAHLVDNITTYIFAFDEDEIINILAALRCHGEEDLANKIAEELYEVVGDI